MPQFITQELFDRMVLALVINTDGSGARGRTSQEVADFLQDVRAAFPQDNFSGELFEGARWLASWAEGNFGSDPSVKFGILRSINERCVQYYPSGGRRPGHTAEAQPFEPRQGERLQAFMAAIKEYALQVVEA